MEIKQTGILIVSAPRCGSTNLMKSLASTYDKNFSFEPDLINQYPKFSYNDVVKIVPFWETHVLHTNSFRYNLLLENIKQFNNIILLKRKNFIEQLESYYVMKKYSTGKIDRKWGNEEINKDDSYYFFKEYLSKTNKVIDRLSADLNLEINYYEDIFKDKKLKNYKLDLSFLDSSNKLKQINKERLV
jgi:hypothetical protein